VNSDLIAALPEVRPVVDEVLAAIHATPELAYEELRTAELLVERLENLGARVDRSVAGLPSCFRAEIGSDHGPAVGVVLPLDAVPLHVEEQGNDGFNAIRPVHACGHSVIAAAVVGAAQLLTVSPELLRGRLVVMGIPGDEIHAPVVRTRGGGKAVTADAGVWDDLDAILYAHPEFLDTVWLSSRWMSRRRIRLHGPRVFSADRHDIVAAFAGMLQNCRTLVNRYGAEWVVIETASFEGDVEDGSPCGAELSVLIFGRDEDELQERLDELNGLIGEACAGSGLSPNIEGHPEGHPSLRRGTRPVYQGILANSVLVSAIAAVFGDSYVPASMQLPFATDFGNLSRRAPSALIGIGRPGGWRFHTEAGADEFASQDGRDVAARLAQVLALTISKLTSDQDLLARARAEFEARRAKL